MRSDSTRPNICCAVAQASQVTKERFEKDNGEYGKNLNKMVKELRKTASKFLCYPKLDKESLRIQCYSDAPWANNADESSQFGYIIFLVDASGACQPIASCNHDGRATNQDERIDLLSEVKQWH